MKFEPSLSFAKQLDQADPLAKWRDEFFIPQQQNGEDELYFCGHSLGLQPKQTPNFIQEVLKDWQQLGVKGHFHARHPWYPYHELLSEPLSVLVGALASETIAMNSLTTNLHLLMTSFYRPTPERHKILIEAQAFPSDRYAVQSQIAFHHYESSSSLIQLKPKDHSDILTLDEIIEAIETEGEHIALVLLPGVQYYTGQYFDIQTITKAAHRKGCLVGFDLAHAIGNCPLALHAWGVDFAVWCHYKYLNSGPGAVGGCFVHEKHHKSQDLPRFAGWWGHDKNTRFHMPEHFRPIASAEAWQLSNPPIFSLASILSALQIFQAVGIEALRAKSKMLTGYCEYLIDQQCDTTLEIITPSSPEERGAQLSLRLNKDKGKDIHQQLIQAGMTCDWREPNVIRIAPVPLYNRYEEVFRFVEMLKVLL